MNKETLRRLEQSEDLRVRNIAKLALIMDINYEEAERLRESESKQLEDPDETQKQYEAALDAEFSY